MVGLGAVAEVHITSTKTLTYTIPRQICQLFEDALEYHVYADIVISAAKANLPPAQPLYEKL